MGYIEFAGIGQWLPDGRPLLADVSFRVGQGVVAALIGPNGTGKTTLLRIAAGEIPADEGVVTSAGELGVMPQFIGSVRDDSTVRDLLLTVTPGPVREAAAALDAAELAMMADDSDAVAMTYAQALADWGDVGGYDWETRFDVATVAALGVPYDRAKFRAVTSLSGGEQKRVVLELLLDGPAQVLLLDEPDNYLDVPGKQWLERRLAQVGESGRSVLFVSHDRELLAAAATRIVTLEPGAAGATSWVHGGSFTGYVTARDERNSRLEELRRRWDEERAKLVALVLMYKTKAAFNDGLASRYAAAQTRLARFESAGPPQAVPMVQSVTMRLRGGRTAKRAVVAEGLGLTGLMDPFDLEVFYGDRLAVLGSNGSGKSHFLRLLAAGGSDPDPAATPVGAADLAPVAHTGTVALGSRVRPGYFRQTHAHPELHGRTLLEILHHGDDDRAGMGREQAARALDRYGLARAGEQTYQTLSGGQQARLQILLLELSGATLLLLDEPTDNLDLHSAQSLEAALAAFDGSVIAITHDRAFARTFDAFLVFGADGSVVVSDQPVWDVQRVRRAR
ncbi:ABC-F family ATP-binding cassette domain-containing protein [Nakamurella flavida]|uniref:ABC-F family ATP-binding cassette domain-containing protein n=1 Tax=Nakamurella flavida TaxID=363630 RepID=A0A938YKV9_9ACTN|nr:ATP-binding cassette domain-containing protein [Nakamurella flavida]MBM9476411.1 ABC-F family ATP-binding cassette domain-containing protein [Nakamurella flavida]MDP9779488.1 ATPase subunit of ABC transporter with duplicated ATPase domains [Nakamurella flavida]